MNLEYTVPIEIKEVAADGTFAGTASVYGVEDLGGDVIDKGAFRKTIAENSLVPVLWQHRTDEVIGQGEVSEWQGKILIKGKLDLDDPTAAKAYRKLKNGLIKGLSIGFQSLKTSFEEVENRVVRHISELKLWEVSIVTFPMLPAAQVTRVKSVTEDRIASLERQILALQANKVATPAKEPAQADEPPAPSTEPDVVHSALSASLDEMLAILRD